MKRILFIILSVFTFSYTVNAQRFLETQITYPDSGMLGSVHYVFYGAPPSTIIRTVIDRPLINVKDTVYGDEVLNIDSVCNSFYVVAYDSITGDTIGRARFFVGTLISNSPYINMYYFRHNISVDSIKQCSASYLCDGIFNATHISNYDTSTYSNPVTYFLRYNIDNINFTYDSVQLSDLNLEGLCEGEYMIDIKVDNSSAYLTTFYIDANVTSTPNYSVDVITYSSHTQTSCDGRAKAIVTNGVPPYFFSWDSNPYSTEDSISNLCVGIHSVSVVDNNSDTVAINFGIADSSSTFNNTNNTGNNAVDSLFFFIESCNINYNIPVDSAFVSYSNIIDSTTIYIECEIWQNGSVTTISDTLQFNVFGVNYVEITFYCNSIKSITNILKITDYIDVNNNINNITDISKTSNIVIYPNPAKNYITITGKDIKSVMITDISGKLVLNIKIYSSKTKINMRDQQEGMYFVKVQTKEGIIVKKILVE